MNITLTNGQKMLNFGSKWKNFDIFFLKQGLARKSSLHKIFCFLVKKWTFFYDRNFQSHISRKPLEIEFRVWTFFTPQEPPNQTYISKPLGNFVGLKHHSSSLWLANQRTPSGKCRNVGIWLQSGHWHLLITGIRNLMALGKFQMG